MKSGGALLEVEDAGLLGGDEDEEVCLAGLLGDDDNGFCLLKHNFKHLDSKISGQISRLCFEIERIRENFSQPTWGVPRVKVASDLL